MNHSRARGGCRRAFLSVVMLGSDAWFSRPDSCILPKVMRLTAPHHGLDLE
jgi:hypothetical protein